MVFLYDLRANPVYHEIWRLKMTLIIAWFQGLQDQQALAEMYIELTANMK